MDPPGQKTSSEFEKDFKEKNLKTKYQKMVRNLTFSNETLIVKLTNLAAENKECAECIVDCIDEQLENVCTYRYSISILKFRRPKLYD